MRRAWNKGLKMPELAVKMQGNTNGRGNKGRKMSPEWIDKLRQAKLGKPSNAKGKSRTPEQITRMSIARRKYLLSINPNYDYSLDTKTRRGNKRVRRERVKRFGGSHTQGEWETLKAQYNFTCPCCKSQEPEIRLTRDHILSLSNGGTDEIKNIQPLCNQCNAKKATKTIRY